MGKGELYYRDIGICTFKQTTSACIVINGNVFGRIVEELRVEKYRLLGINVVPRRRRPGVSE